jgi:hypothetical protein
MASPTDQGAKSLYAQVLVEDIFDALNQSGALTDEEVIAVLERLRDILRGSGAEAAGRAIAVSERALITMRKRED